MNRMSDERLAEIEEKERIHFPDGSKSYFAKSYLTEELMQALKAEREKVEELEAQLQVQEQEAFGQLKPLQDKLQRIGELPETWRDISRKTTEEYTNLHGCADELQAALEGSDE